jgi:hypothetical protein
LALLLRRRGIERDSCLTLKEIAGLELPASERLQQLVELTKLERERMPWYERSLSAIGVVAFISMSIATGFQTIKSSIDSVKAEQLRKEVQDLQRESAEMTVPIANAAKSLEIQGRREGWIDQSAKGLLRVRLQVLQREPNPSKDDIQEMFFLSLLVSDPEMATRLANGSPEILNAAPISDLVALAEDYYYIDDKLEARQVLKMIVGSESLTNTIYITRYYRLRAALESLDSTVVHQFAVALKVSDSDAKDRLKSEAKALELSAQDWRVGSVRP